MRSAALALVVVVSLAVTACSGGNKSGGKAQKKTIVLTMASQISGGQPAQLERFAAEVARQSRGAMRIDFRPNWRAGEFRQERNTIADVRTGKVDLAWVGGRAWDWVGVTSFDGLVAPFLIDRYRLEQKVFEQGIPQRMLTGVSRAGVVGVGVLPGPMRRQLGVRSAFARASDFRGATVGVQGVVAADTLSALGARPRQVFARTSLAGLDALEQQVGSIMGNQYDTTARYVSANLNFWPRPFVIFAGPKIYRSLTDEQQGVLREAVTATVPDAVAASKREDTDSVSVLCCRGKLRFVGLTPGELQGLRRAVAPVYERLERRPNTRRTILAIEALKRGTPRDPALGCVGSRTAARQQGASPLDGRWEMSVRHGDLVGNPAYGHHTPTAEDLRLDEGRYRLVLRDGRVTWSLLGPATQSYSTGVFAVRGGTIVFRMTGGHDAGDPPWTYRWSIYRDVLTLRRVGESIPNPAFAPWHRVR